MDSIDTDVAAAVAPGESANYDIQANGNGNGTVNWSLAGLPSAATAVFNPASSTGRASWSTVLTVSTTISCSPGAYPLTISAGVGIASGQSVLLVRDTTDIMLAAVGGSIKYGDTLLLAAALPVGDKATGIVLLDNGVRIATNTVNASGLAVFAMSGLAIGTHALSVVDAGKVKHTSATITQVVSKVDQTISFVSLGSVTYGITPLALTATASSGLPVSFAVVSGPATISGDTISITGAGNVTVAATQSGDATYNAAPGVQRSFTVLPTPLTVSGLNAKDKIYDGTTTATVDANGAQVTGVNANDSVSLDFSAVNGAFENPNVGKGKPVQVNGLALKGAAAANYTLVQPISTASILPPSPTLFISTTTTNATLVTVGGSVTGQPWALEASADLASGNWQRLMTNTTDSAGTCVFVDTGVASNPSRFYRAVMP